MENNNLKENTIKSLIWKFFERVGAQLIQFVVSIVLARLLLPSDYGAIALIMVFISIAQIFTQGGFSVALIRKVDADELDYSSVFYFSVVISVLMYIVIFFTAPVIANFYKMPELKTVLRVLALIVIIGNYNSMQNTILAKNMLFKKLFISTFGATIISGALGIAIAIYGYGIWALVVQQLSAVIMTTVIMFFTVKWHPKLMFSFKRIKELIKFGWKLFLSALLDVTYNNLYSLFIGKKFSSSELGYWNRGKQFPDLIVNNINGAIGSVMFPVFSRLTEDKIQLKQALRRSIKMSAYFVIPVMAGLAICAKPIVKLLLGEAWISCVPFVQGWCFCYALMPIHTTNLQVYNALGRSDIFLYLEIAKKVLGVATLLITLPFGLKWMMLGLMLSGVFGGILNALPNIFILRYSIWEQIKDLSSSIIISIIMCGAVYGCSFIPIQIEWILIIQIVVGIIVYAAISSLFKVEAFVYSLTMLKNFLKTYRLNKKTKSIHKKN